MFDRLDVITRVLSVRFNDFIGSILGIRKSAQGYHVENALRSAGLSAGCIATVDFRRVAITDSVASYWRAEVTVRMIFKYGDGGDLISGDVTAPMGLSRFLKAGYYDIIGATVTANGLIFVDARRAQVTPVGELQR